MSKTIFLSNARGDDEPFIARLHGDLTALSFGSPQPSTSQRIENPPAATRVSRLFWIMGTPGVGKGAFAAKLTRTRGDTVNAAQFCEWDEPVCRNSPRVGRSLAFQLATRLPDYREPPLTLPKIAELERQDAAELFDYLLATPLRSVINGDGEQYLIVIDPLDDVWERPVAEALNVVGSRCL
jgi:hypothetical protein